MSVICCIWLVLRRWCWVVPGRWRSTTTCGRRDRLSIHRQIEADSGVESRGPQEGRWREMFGRVSIGLILAILGVHLQAQTPERQTTVTGELGRVMAIG